MQSVGKREISDVLFSQNSTVKSRAPLSGFSHLELVEAVFAQEEWHQGYQKSPVLNNSENRSMAVLRNTGWAMRQVERAEDRW
jgi:hypothetical protein